MGRKKELGAQNFFDIGVWQCERHRVPFSDDISHNLHLDLYLLPFVSGFLLIKKFIGNFEAFQSFRNLLKDLDLNIYVISLLDMLFNFI